MKLFDNLQEKIILEKLKHKDPGAYAEVYNRYVDKIYRFIFFKVSTQEEAEDIASEVFLKAWQYINQGEGEIRNINAFFYQIARNAVIDYYRKKSRVELVREESILQSLEDHRQQRLLKEIDIRTDIKKVEGALKSLKDEYKDVILLRYVEEMSIEEISVAVDKSKGAVRVLIHRALKLLKEVLL